MLPHTPYPLRVNFPRKILRLSFPPKLTTAGQVVSSCVAAFPRRFAATRVSAAPLDSATTSLMAPPSIIHSALQTTSSYSVLDGELTFRHGSNVRTTTIRSIDNLPTRLRAIPSAKDWSIEIEVPMPLEACLATACQDVRSATHSGALREHRA